MLNKKSNPMRHIKFTRVLPILPLLWMATPNNGQAQAGKGMDVSKGSQIGYVYEAYLSPWQEPGEEEDTPAYIPKQFHSTKPSKLRKDRPDRGYGRISFTNDLSKAIVEVKVTDVDLDDINMFHIHCGRPDQLGPILVDFAISTDIITNFKDDGVFQVEITDLEIVAEANSGEGLVGAFTAGCPIIPGTKEKVQTVAGMELIAQHGELYFNLHTNSQTYYGDMRGQIHDATPESAAAAKESLKNGINPTPKPKASGMGGHGH